MINYLGQCGYSDPHACQSFIRPQVSSPQVFVAVRLRRSPSTCSPYVRKLNKVTSGPNLNDGLARNAVYTLSFHTASFFAQFSSEETVSQIVCAIRYDIIVHDHICDSGLGGRSLADVNSVLSYTNTYVKL